MSTKEIENHLSDIICNYVDLSTVKLSCDSSLLNDIGIDSFSLISIVTDIEDHFNICINDEDLISFSTFNDIISYISARI